MLRGRSESAKSLRWTIDHGDRNLGSDAPPVLPAVELREIVSAHDPDKAQAGSAAAQISHSVYRISRSDDGFETADIDARIAGHLARGLGAFLEIVQRSAILQRGAGRHQPPAPIDLQSLDRKQADGAMGNMGRIERAAEQPNAHTVGIKWDGWSNRWRGVGSFV